MVVLTLYVATVPPSYTVMLLYREPTTAVLSAALVATDQAKLMTDDGERSEGIDGQIYIVGAISRLTTQVTWLHATPAHAHQQTTKKKKVSIHKIHSATYLSDMPGSGLLAESISSRLPVTELIRIR